MMSVPKTDRLQRGVRLYQERGDEITRTTGGTFIVPSCSNEGEHFVVYLGEITCCSCPDHRAARKATPPEWCKHVHAASIVAAKRRAARRRAS